MKLITVTIALAVAMTSESLPSAQARTPVYSYTVAHYAANKALADSLPYTVVLVSLDDAPQIRVIGNLIGGTEVQIGMPVVAEWDEHTADDGTTILLPQWRPAT